MKVRRVSETVKMTKSSWRRSSRPCWAKLFFKAFQESERSSCEMPRVHSQMQVPTQMDTKTRMSGYWILRAQIYLRYFSWICSSSLVAGWSDLMLHIKCWFTAWDQCFSDFKIFTKECMRHQPIVHSDTHITICYNFPLQSATLTLEKKQLNLGRFEPDMSITWLAVHDGWGAKVENILGVHDIYKI